MQRGVLAVCAVLAALVLPSTGFAQDDPPVLTPTPPGGGSPVTGDPAPPIDKPSITATPRFAPLIKGEFIAQPRGGGYVRQTTDKITCTFNPATLLPGYTILHYYWSGLDFGNPAPDSATVTGYAHEPGAVTVTCVVEIVANTPGAVPFKTDPWKSKTVYVVGGPLSLGVSGGIPGTPDHDAANSLTQKAGPWYIENFGFDPSGPTPRGAQSPQSGTVSALGGQPSGTTYEWTVPGPLVRTDTAAGSTSLIGVGATSGSGGGGIQVECKYRFDNGVEGDRVTGSIMDDSLDTPGIDGQKNAALYQFDAHKPDSLVNLDAGTNNPIHVGGNYHNDREYKYQLHDDGGAIMGAVYIVERFTTAQPYNQALSVWPPTADGTITDTFWIDLGTAHATDYWTFLHTYWAGTTDTGTTQQAVSGVLVLTTTSHVGTTTITNDGGTTRP